MGVSKRNGCISGRKTKECNTSRAPGDESRTGDKDSWWTQPSESSASLRHLHKRYNQRTPSTQKRYLLQNLLHHTKLWTCGITFLLRIGKLRIGDQLLQANGQSLVGVSNEEYAYTYMYTIHHHLSPSLLVLLIYSDHVLQLTR